MPTYFAQENLFDSTPNNGTPVDTTQTTVNNSAVNSTSTGLNLDLSSTIFSDGSIKSFIFQLNSFTLAWCIFYSVLFVADFYFYRLKYSDGVIDRERLGVDSLKRAFNIWFSYFFCWIALVVYGYVPLLGFITIMVYFGKLLIADLPLILDIIHDYVGLNGIHTNYKKIVAPLIKLLKLDFKK
jgi:hypothetical protein